MFLDAEEGPAERSKKRIRSVKDTIAYAELTLERMYSLRDRIAAAEKRITDLLTQIDRDKA